MNTCMCIQNYKNIIYYHKNIVHMKKSVKHTIPLNCSICADVCMSPYCNKCTYCAIKLYTHIMQCKLVLPLSCHVYMHKCAHGNSCLCNPQCTSVVRSQLFHNVLRVNWFGSHLDFGYITPTRDKELPPVFLLQQSKVSHPLAVP